MEPGGDRGGSLVSIRFASPLNLNTPCPHLGLHTSFLGKDRGSSPFGQLEVHDKMRLDLI